MHICYALAFAFPDSSAATRRVSGVVSLLASCKFVTVVSAGMPRAIPEDLGIPRDVRIIFVEKDEDGNVNGVFKKLTFGSDICSEIERIDQKIDVVIAYGGYAPMVLRLLKLKQKMNIKVIYDAVEWASLRPNWWLSPYLINVHLAMSCLLKKMDGVICVSQFLYDYYQGETRVLRLPPLSVEPSNNLLRKRKSAVCKLSYVGNSDHDNVDLIIKKF